MHISTKRELGLVLRDLRRRRGLTQAALADVLGVSRRWVNQVEQAKTNADISTVLRALKELGVEISVVPRATPTRDRLAEVLRGGET